MSIEFGLFPLTGILLAGLLYGIYWLLLRKRCHPRTSQWFIVASVVVSLLVSFVQPVRYDARHSRFERSSLDRQHSESKEPLIVVDGTVLGYPPEAPHGMVSDDESQLCKILDIDEDNISSVTVLKGTASKAVYGSKGENGVIEVTTRKSLLPMDFFTRKATKIMRYIYLAGLCVMLIYMLTQILWLIRVRRRSTHMELERGVRVYDTDIPTPFSFANSVFMPRGMDEGLRNDVLVHEREHIRHHHYAKLCVMHLLHSLGWFNPFVWLFAKEQKVQQEMEVDCEVMKGGYDRERYQINLLKMCLKHSSWVQIMPAFGSSVIKRRILFMNNWKPSRSSTIRISAAFLMLLLMLGTTAFATFQTKVQKCPIDGCWTCEWIRNTDEKYENVPSLAGNMFYGNDMMMNFSWFSRYNGVNMRFNFSGEPQVWSNGRIYDYKGDEMDITLKDGGKKFRKRFKRTPKMTNLVDGADVTEEWRRVEPDMDVLRILNALRSAGQDNSHPVYGVWQENNDTDPYQFNYYVVSGDIFARFTIYQDPDNYWCSAGGWCGDFRYEAEDRVFMSDRISAIEWHNKDSMTLIIPRDSDRLEPHNYHRSKLPDRFLRCLSASEGYE